MQNDDITRYRLGAHQLNKPRETGPADVVSWYGAVQAQDFAAAKWALGLRLSGSTDTAIEAAFNKGDIIRTHVMRPTWHFVAPGDICWLQQLTAARVQAACVTAMKKRGIDAAALKKSLTIFERALEGTNHLTRPELMTCLEQVKIKTDGIGASCIMIYAETQCIVCSGPLRGKQFTYALLEERVPATPQLSRDEALAALTMRYFTAHGPATVQDMSWWCGLTLADVRKGVNLVGKQLSGIVVNGQQGWWVPTETTNAKMDNTCLLPPFDEYMVGYKERRDLWHPGVMGKPVNGDMALLGPVVLVNGKAAGTWRRSFKKGAVVMEVTLHVPAGRVMLKKTEEAVQQYCHFHGMKPELNIATAQGRA